MHSILCAGLALALAGIGLPQIFREASRTRFGPVDSLHSIERYLWGMHGAERAREFLERLASVPPDRPVLIFIRADGASSMPGVAFSYLVWPRPVQLIGGDDGTAAEKLAAVRPDSVGAVVFCNITPPPWFPRSEPCAPGVRIAYINPGATK